MADWHDDLNLRPGHRVLWNGAGHTVTNAGQDDIHNRLNPHLMPPEGHYELRPDRPGEQDRVIAPIHELTRLPDYAAGDRVSGSSDDNPYWHGTVVGVDNQNARSQKIQDALAVNPDAPVDYDPTLMVRWDNHGLRPQHPAGLRMVEQGAEMPADPEGLPDTIPWGEEEQNYYRNARTAADWHEEDHPRGQAGKFRAKHDVHEIPVHDHKGKLLYTAKRCKHCGHVYGKPANHKGRLTCPTCGEDPERVLRRAHLGANPQDTVAQEFGWQSLGMNANGHRMYGSEFPNQAGQMVKHLVTGYGNHQGDPVRAAKQLRSQMRSCMNGTCTHIPDIPDVNMADMAGAPLIQAGQEVTYGGQTWWVMEHDGGLALIYNQQGQEEMVPTAELRAAKTAETLRWTPNTVPWITPQQKYMPGGWSELREHSDPFSPDWHPDVCPFCGEDMDSPDFCRHCHRRVSSWAEMR